MVDVKVGTLIWYMMNGRFHSAPVLAKMVVENLHPDWTDTIEQARRFTPFGGSGTFYGTCHGLVNANEAFESKESLVESLLKVS